MKSFYPIFSYIREQQKDEFGELHWGKLSKAKK